MVKVPSLYLIPNESKRKKELKNKNQGEKKFIIEEKKELCSKVMRNKIKVKLNKKIKIN